MSCSSACGLKQYTVQVSPDKAIPLTDEAEVAIDDYVQQQKVEPGDLEFFKCVEVQYEMPGPRETSWDILTCDFCPNKSFHGQYRRRSWRRHMVAEHSDGPRIPCPEGCDKTFVPGRVDNVKRHVEKYHR